MGAHLPDDRDGAGDFDALISNRMNPNYPIALFFRIYQLETNRKSELEIDERLQVGGDELVDDEHDEGADHYHQR